MKILAFDTSHAAISVALLCDGVVYAVHEPRQEKQGTHLLPVMFTLLQQAQVTLADLDRLAIGIGPGSFTGLRVGCSAAQAISFAHDLPIIPISSLQLLAQTAFSQYGGTHFLVAVDAKQDQCYCGQYRFDPVSASVRLVGKETMIAGNITDHTVDVRHQEEYSDVIQTTTLAVGDAWRLYPQRLLNYFAIHEQPMLCPSDCSPTASAMFDLAREADKNHQYINATALSPHYLNDMPFSIPF